MRSCLGAVLAFIAFMQGPACAVAADASVVSALHLALDRHVAHARGWLDAADFKSLAQSAGGLEMLAEVLRAQSDDEAWQTVNGRVVAAAKDVRAAAQAEDAEHSHKALANMERQMLAVSKAVPRGEPLPPPKAGLRQLMLLMDGVRGDAKIALIAGNVESAKNQAHVLSELGRVVSNLRSGERWSRLSEEFTEASQAAARSSSTDAVEVRLLFRGVSQRCDACHETR